MWTRYGEVQQVLRILATLSHKGIAGLSTTVVSSTCIRRGKEAGSPESSPGHELIQ